MYSTLCNKKYVYIYYTIKVDLLVNNICDKANIDSLSSESQHNNSQTKNTRATNNDYIQIYLCIPL